jgi:3-hydroxyisobutyrate dehydrogenase-like beta-hydroxyacid dehydrogenase
MTQTIGFIGLGLMGAGFTKRLVSQGIAVVGHDIDASKLDAAKDWGVKPAASPAEVASRCDLICICVTTTKAVAAVVSGDDGIVSAGKLDGKVIVDFSTTEMATTKSVAAALATPARSSSTAPFRAGRRRPRPARSPSWPAATMMRSRRPCPS